MRFGTIIADPPWNYDKASSNDRKNRGYASYRTGDGYPLLDTPALCGLPVGELAAKDSVLLLWCTMPFIPDGLEVIRSWGFKYVTALPWIKVAKGQETEEQPSLPYGVGYWFRGAAEMILVGKRGKAYRTNHVGLLSESFKHSRKPDSVHELAEKGDDPFPGPYLELFGRRARAGWTVVGNEAPEDGLDIRDSIDKLLA